MLHSNETPSIQKYFHGMVPFIQYVVLSLWMKSYDVTLQIKPPQQYFHMVISMSDVVL